MEKPMSTSSGKQDPDLGRYFEAAKAIVHAVQLLYFVAEAARRGNQVFEKLSDEAPATPSGSAETVGSWLGTSRPAAALTA